MARPPRGDRGPASADAASPQRETRWPRPGPSNKAPALHLTRPRRETGLFPPRLTGRPRLQPPHPAPVAATAPRHAPLQPPRFPARPRFPSHTPPPSPPAGLRRRPPSAAASLPPGHRSRSPVSPSAGWRGRCILGKSSPTWVSAWLPRSPRRPAQLPSAARPPPPAAEREGRGVEAGPGRGAGTRRPGPRRGGGRGAARPA